MQPTSKKIAGILSSSLNAYFVRRLMAGLEPTLRHAGWGIKVFELEGKSALEYHRFIESVADDKELSGLIYGHLRLNVNQVARFKQRGLPVIGATERMEGIDWVTVDELHGAYLATEHLLAKGHRRIAIINGPPVALQARLREEGFLRALEDAKLRQGKEVQVYQLNFTEEEGRQAANMLLDLPQPPTAIFVAAGDVTALGVVAALKARGLRVPQDISVVGFDDLEFTAAMDPPLTTVAQPLEAMGAWAAQRLIDISAMPNSKTRGELMEPQLIERASVMVPKGVGTRASEV